MRFTALLAIAFASSVLADGGRDSQIAGAIGEPQSYGSPSGHGYGGGEGEQTWASSPAEVPTSAAPATWSTPEATLVAPTTTPEETGWATSKAAPVEPGTPTESWAAPQTWSTPEGASWTSQLSWSPEESWSSEAPQTWPTPPPATTWGTKTHGYTSPANASTPTQPVTPPVWTGAASAVQWTRGAGLFALLGLVFV